MIKIRILRWSGPIVITSVLTRKVRVRDGDARSGAEAEVMQGPEPGNEGSL